MFIDHNIMENSGQGVDMIKQKNHTDYVTWETETIIAIVLASC